ncbi:MAG TPA: 3-deoxy-D-manno-octulosonic acid transferase [Verrucomicrobiae bacterium]|jgi:3-deoxy-D-manno-octulosonic-acid transferase|nr:3-deoxy-D-manno-octulosonic acid transferase [Verrucomicrobiae bacterium]
MILFVLASPYYFWRLRRRPANWTTGFGERFANYDPSVKQALTNRQTIWLHAVSVGEIGLCTQLISALEPRVPNAKIVVSCTTTTGMEEYRKKLPSRITKIYYPVDRRKYVRRAIATINPEAIVLLEAEIWPNFLWRAADLKIPVFLANARMSERSYPRYKKFGWLFGPLFASFAGVSCENDEEAQKLRDVGCRPASIQAVGNLKFVPAVLTEKRSLDVRGMLRQIGVADDALILVAGSTHDGEEILLVDIMTRLRKRFPNLFLILVPRHNERCHDLGRKLKAQGVKCILRSAIFANTKLHAGEMDCLLVNTIGELKFFYETASIVFIGKSLTAIGGQNPIEPAALGKPVVFGPNMQNFKDITRLFLSKEAAVQVKDPAALERVLAELLESAARRAELGRRALQVVAENQGAVEHTVEMILPQLAQRNIIVVPKKEPVFKD